MGGKGATFDEEGDLRGSSRAIVGPGWSTSWAYARAHLKGADCLVEQVNALGTSPDWLVYPVLHLYRHAAELALKWAIIVAETLADLRANEGGETIPGFPEHVGEDGLNKTHKIGALFDLFKARILALYPEWDIASVEGPLRTLHDADDTGQRFRYDSVKRGQGRDATTQRSFAEPEYVSLFYVRDVVGRAVEAVIEIGEYADLQIDQIREVVANLRRNYEG